MSAETPNTKSVAERFAASRGHWPSYEESKDLQVLVSTMKGSYRFDDLDSAKRKFPSLDPWKNTKKFTWATKDRYRGRLVMRFDDWEMHDIMTRAASEKTAGMAMMRKMIRVKARVHAKELGSVTSGMMYGVNGMLWLDIDGAEAEPFRFKAEVYRSSPLAGGGYDVLNFAPLQGALSGGAKGLASFYEQALQELINENPQLIG
jgi:hypothetical protein